MAARNQWDGAIGTMTVATLTDLYIGIMGRGSDYSRKEERGMRNEITLEGNICVRSILLPHSSFLIPRNIFQQVPIIKLPIPPVHLRNLLLKVGKVTL
jgi:hypothetical protein